MQFKAGTHVYTANEESVGEIDRVVLDPGTKAVTHLVVRKGWLFKQDRLIHVDMINSATEQRVVLREDVGDLSEVLPYEEAHYVQVPEGETNYPSGFTLPMFYYPPLGAGWTGAPPTPPTLPTPAMQNVSNIPEHSIALKVGAAVLSADDQQVGSIEQVLTSERDGQITHFVIAAGAMFKERRLIPANWVHSVSEDRVQLAVSTRVLEGLREYHPAH